VDDKLAGKLASASASGCRNCRLSAQRAEPGLCSAHLAASLVLPRPALWPGVGRRYEEGLC
jgi:hypothetical protein